MLITMLPLDNPLLLRCFAFDGKMFVYGRSRISFWIDYLVHLFLFGTVPAPTPFFTRVSTKEDTFRERIERHFAIPRYLVMGQVYVFKT